MVVLQKGHFLGRSPWVTLIFLPQLGQAAPALASAGLKHIADSFLGNSPPGAAFPCRIGRRARLRGHRLVRGCLARSYHAVKSIDRGHLGALAPITKKPP